MKWLYVFAVFTFVSSAYSASVSYQDPPDVFSIVRNKCRQNSGGEQAFVELEGAAQAFQQCAMSSQASMLPNPVYTEARFCDYYKSESNYGCIENILSKMEPCLASDEKYISDFMLTSYNVTVDQTCGPRGVDEVNEIYSTITNNQQCLVLNVDYQTISSTCLSNLKVVRSVFSGSSVVKEDLCSDLTDAIRCIASTLESKCSGDYHHLLNLYFTPYLDWCTQHLLHELVSVERLK